MYTLIYCYLSLFPVVSPRIPVVTFVFLSLALILSQTLCKNTSTPHIAVRLCPLMSDFDRLLTFVPNLLTFTASEDLNPTLLKININ